MKQVSLAKFVPGYAQLVKDALKKKEQIMVTSRGLPFFICVPVKPEVNYKPVNDQNLKG